MDTRLDKLEQAIKELQSDIMKQKNDKPQPPKTPRAPSEYNEFLKKYVEEQKKKPDYDHKKAFKGAAIAWGEKKKLNKS